MEYRNNNNYWAQCSNLLYDKKGIHDKLNVFFLHRNIHKGTAYKRDLPRNRLRYIVCIVTMP